MAKDSLLTNDESVIDGALERFERAEAELGEVEERRKHAVDEAARAGAGVGEAAALLGIDLD